MPQLAEPVKFVIERSAAAGQAPALESWAKELVAVAARDGALQGSSVLATGTGHYVVLLRFAGQEDLDRWRATPEVGAILERAQAFSTGDAPEIRTGLETWFSLPGGAVPPKAPPKWKMALVTWLSLLPQVVALSFVVPHGLPLIAKAAVSTAIPVSMLTWVVMPWLTRALSGWLYASQGAR